MKRNIITIFGVLNSKISSLLKTTKDVTTDVGTLQTTVGGLQTTVGGLQTDVGGLQTDVDKLKLLQNSITVGLSSDTTTSVTSAYSSVDLIFDSEIAKTGTLLTLESGKLKIGKGIKKIIVSAKVQTQGDNTSWGINILKSGSAIASSFEGNPGTGWCQLVITPFEIPVTENDLISVNIYHNVANSTKTIKSYLGGGTYLTIQVIE